MIVAPIDSAISDYSPEGFASADALHLSAMGGEQFITGLDGGYTDRAVSLVNVGEHGITLVADDTYSKNGLPQSIPINRFIFDKSATIPPSGTLVVRHDGSGWRLESGVPVGDDYSINGNLWDWSLGTSFTDPQNEPVADSWVAFLRPSEGSGGTISRIDLPAEIMELIDGQPIYGMEVDIGGVQHTNNVPMVGAILPRPRLFSGNVATVRLAAEIIADPLDGGLNLGCQFQQRISGASFNSYPAMYDRGLVDDGWRIYTWHVPVVSLSGQPPGQGDFARVNFLFRRRPQTIRLAGFQISYGWL